MEAKYTPAQKKRLIIGSKKIGMPTMKYLKITTIDTKQKNRKGSEIITQ